MDLHHLKEIAVAAAQGQRRGMSKKKQARAVARAVGTSYVQSSQFDALVERVVHGVVATLVHKATAPVQRRLTRGFVGTSRHVARETLKKL